MTYARRPTAGKPAPINSRAPINSGAVIGEENKKVTQ
jgi:hypothetical protein